ncbi:hypothetical protein [Aquabacterium sp. A08]|uniref:hypothetical protein n=1 Tax=Aquabacterium sp. A08 TaxID=2718532 RepID=UPI00141F9618|nr:hypothetical protein [Aquabacterium sp. A08]NIC42840.1 hypothetical protein [Aquabacterium sp. A08]
MKIPSNPMAAVAREPVKTAARAERNAPAEAPAEPTPSVKVPPGLERVLAKFEALGEAGRSAGQSNAMDRIARNLARYTDTQALVPPADGPATAPAEPEAPPLAEAPPETPLGDAPLETAPGTNAPGADSGSDPTDALLDALTAPDTEGSDGTEPTA